MRTVYDNLRDYFIPSLFVYVPGAGGGLDSEFDWSGNIDPADEHSIVTAMEEFFAPFPPHRHPRRVQALHDYQRVFRFGATMLTLCRLLTILGIAIGPRRSRVGVFLFGVSGFVLLLPESFVGTYLGRYTVPIAGPMGARRDHALGAVVDGATQALLRAARNGDWLVRPLSHACREPALGNGWIGTSSDSSMAAAITAAPPESTARSSPSPPIATAWDGARRTRITQSRWQPNGPI